ncbi:hypothetical protein OFAG_01179 [Oxalobacter formigenes HOxBLS]|uniref:Porin domain-containing protein n=2 Tax=Oxalobacter paraformigenes TaxID=556268 RepID=C3X490_9BURK|nr:hypothetical protein OFAG_01179 [Oxalobacter paraformigenes]
MAKDLKKCHVVLTTGITAMKNLLFYRSSILLRPLLKGLAFCLPGFLAGLMALPSLAATPPSPDPALSSAPAKKGQRKKKLSAHARQSVANRNGNATETVVSGWQTRQPFSAASPAIPEKRTLQGQPASGQPLSGTWDRLSLKPAIAILPADSHTGSPFFHRTSSVFRKKTADTPFDAGKTASFNTGTEAAKTVSLSGETDASNSGYFIGPARFTVNYEKANDRSREKMAQFLSGKATPDIAGNDLVESRFDRDNWRVGMEYAAGNGRVNAALNYVHMKDVKGANDGNDHSPDAADLKTFTIGYTYDVSEKTSFYGMVARTEYEREAMAGYLRGSGFDEDSVTGFQLGVTHKF